MDKIGAVLILAAGRGTRMHSNRPKVLHPLAMKPLLAHVLEQVRMLSPERILTVVGYGSEQIQQMPHTEDVVWILQQEQLGTGHAVHCALAEIATLTSDPLLILNGDTPLIDATILDSLIAAHRNNAAALTLLTTEVHPPTGYGRVLRNSAGEVLKIVEERDADALTQSITEINSGIYCVATARLPHWIKKISNNNAQKEYYLTDIIAFALEEYHDSGYGSVGSLLCPDATPLLGINSRQQLAQMEKMLRNRLVAFWMERGVTFTDPDSCWLATDVTIGQDTEIFPNVTLGPGTVIGNSCQIGPFCHITMSRIGDGTTILPFCHIEGTTTVGPNMVGPYARLRPETLLEPSAKIGNFCELKKAHIGAGSKINHLSYIGDTKMGSGVNVGAGTITCNYDGLHKYETVIGDHVFIGSDTQLIAPVTIEEQAVIGAGSTITKDVPAAALALSRSQQHHIKQWALRRPSKKGEE